MGKSEEKTLHPKERRMGAKALEVEASCLSPYNGCAASQISKVGPHRAAMAWIQELWCYCEVSAEERWSSHAS